MKKKQPDKLTCFCGSCNLINISDIDHEIFLCQDCGGLVLKEAYTTVTRKERGQYPQSPPKKHL